jgi:hypothetical protein
MKKLFLALLICIYWGQSLVAQSVYTNKNDVFGAATFTFYGFDYTGLKLADGSRVGQDFKKFFPSLSKVLLAQYNEKKLEINFRKAKGAITFNSIPTETENDKINNGKFVTQVPQKISPDSLSLMVKTYQILEKDGIGSVIIFDCFNREAETVTAHMVFFDISTRTVLYAKNIESEDRNGYNYMADWKAASVKAVNRLLDVCANDFNEYRKEQRNATKK